MLRLHASFLILLLFAYSPPVLFAQELVSEKAPSKHSLGVGVGLPYGTLGVNLDICILENLSLSSGLGSTIYAGPGYASGLKYFLADAKSIFRPRLSCYYGTNSILIYEDKKDLNKAYSGISAGLGAQLLWQKTKNGFDFDLFYVATSQSNLELKNRVVVAIGFRRAF